MKIKIKSYYYYNDNLASYLLDGTQYDDCLEETFEARISSEGNQTKIEHSDGSIIIEPNKIIQERIGNKLIIEIGKTNQCLYKTEHGNMNLDIEGISIEKGKIENELCRATYKITTKGAQPYKVLTKMIKM